MLHWYGMQKWRVLLSILLLAITGLVLWYAYLRQTPSTPPGLVYNTITQRWEEAADTNPTVRREEISQEDNVDGLHNYTLLRGYFDRYEIETLQLKATAPFSQGNLIENLE